MELHQPTHQNTDVSMTTVLFDNSLCYTQALLLVGGCRNGGQQWLHDVSDVLITS